MTKKKKKKKKIITNIKNYKWNIFLSYFIFSCAQITKGLKLYYFIISIQLAITYSKLIIETIEQEAKYVQS